MEQLSIKTCKLTEVPRVDQTERSFTLRGVCFLWFTVTSCFVRWCDTFSDTWNQSIYLKAEMFTLQSYSTVWQPAQLALSDLALTGSCAGIHFSPSLCCCVNPVWPGGRPRRPCEGHLWRRRLTKARGLPEAEKKSASSVGPRSLPVCVCLCECVFLLNFHLQTTNWELVYSLRQLWKYRRHMTSSCESPWKDSGEAFTVDHLRLISSLKTLRFWYRIMFRSSRIAEGIMERLF